MSYVSACPQCIKHLARIAELEAALLDVPDSWAQEKKELEAKLAKAQRQITHDGETLLKLGSELAYQKSRWNPASEQLTALEKRAGQAEAKLAEAENLVRVEIVRRGIAEVEVERLSEQLRLCTVPDGWETWRHQAEADLARLVGAVERVINYAVDLHGSYKLNGSGRKLRQIARLAQDIARLTEPGA